jgi:transcriptional regulator with XRE-family HTH domain
MIEKQSNLIKIGKKIRELRKERKFSQENFAAAAGLGRTYMGRVERGEQNISIQNLIQIAFALKVQVGELIPALSELEKPIARLENGINLEEDR